MHLVVLRRGGPLRNHRAICDPRVDHGDLAVGLVLLLLAQHLFATGAFWILLDKAALHILIVLILQTLLNEWQVVEALVRVVELAV